MQRHAIVIGVDRTGELPVLSGAAHGAGEFHRWCQSQTVDATLLVDGHGNTVNIGHVRTAISAVDPRIYSQLIVFFAGHGILKSPDEEYWLLSGSPRDQYDAVNVLQSIAYSRNSGFRHIVIISDACRAIPTSPLLMGVKGMSIFDNRGRTAVRPRVDQLYATAPSDPAYEAKLEDALTADGVFTKELLEALKGHVNSVAEPYQNQWYVTARGLDPYLAAQVPLSVGRINPQYRQVPEVRPEASLPLYLAELPGWAAQPGAGMPLGVPSQSPPASLGDVINAIGSQATPGTPVHEAANELRQASGRQGFESGAGFSIVGATVANAHAQGASCDVFQEDSTWQVRVRPHEVGRLEQPTSVLIEFVDGTGTVLAIWPGYVGVVSVQDGRVVNVGYNPARHTPEYEDFVAQESAIVERRSLVAAAARHGRFRVSSESAEELADNLRQLKRIDPTLGLYAAYAYAQAGNVEQVRSVVSYMFDDLGVVPFDVLLLAGEFPTKQRRVPFCPMLTQGWARIDVTQSEQLDAPVMDAWAHLIPSLWTTFNAVGVKLVRTMFETVDAESSVTV